MKYIHLVHFFFFFSFPLPPHKMWLRMILDFESLCSGIQNVSFVSECMTPKAESSWVWCAPRARVFSAFSALPSFFINSAAGQGGSSLPLPQAILPISIHPRHPCCHSIQTVALHFRAQILQTAIHLEFSCYSQERMQPLGLCHI